MPKNQLTPRTRFSAWSAGTGAGAHDLLRLARRGRMLDWAGQSQYYTEPKRLAKLGYLEGAEGAGQDDASGPIYTLTDKGQQALREYARTPVSFTPLKSEPLLRLLITDLVGEAVTRESMATLRDDIADLAARLDDGEATAELLPHRRKYLMLVIDFLRKYLDLHLELVDEVEREFAAEPERSATS